MSTLILPADKCGPEHAEWFAARRQGVTASEIAVVLGISPWNSPFNLYHHKTGAIDGDPDNDQMRIGRELENYVIRRFAENHPELRYAFGGLYAHEAREWQLATPDGRLYEETPLDYVFEEDEEPELLSCLEAKTVASWDDWGDEGSDDMPVYYKAQGLWQADVMGVPEVRFAVLNRASGEYREYVVAHDKDELRVMRKEAEAFLGRVDRAAPPPVDSAASTTTALRQLHPDMEDEDIELGTQLAARYRSAVRKRKAADEREDFYKNKVRAALGDARVAVYDGQKVATRVRSTVKGHWRAESARDYINPAKEKT